MPVKAVQTWEVIGGAISGGLLVRTGKGLGQDEGCIECDSRLLQLVQLA